MGHLLSMPVRNMEIKEALSFMIFSFCFLHQVLFGTTDGQVIVMSANGAMLAQVTLVDGTEITGMAWSCEKFYLDERDSNDNENINNQGEYGA